MPGRLERRLVRKDLNTHVDLEFEYKGHMLKFQDVGMSGTVHSGPATLIDPAWSYFNFEIDLTPAQIQEWVVEQFEDEGQPVPPWAYTDGKQLLIELRDYAEQQVFSE